MTKALKLEISGIFFISILGSLLHFTFNWLNRFWLVGAFSAVNESTWEHLKLAVVPAILWVILESKVFKLKANNFLFAKAAGVYLMPIAIAAIFYSYKAILGHHLLVLDILTFVAAVIIGQMASYGIMLRPEFTKKHDIIWVSALIALFLAFVIFTFCPPQNFIFKDQVSGLYGIIK